MKYDLFDLGMIISRDYLCWWVASWTISGNNLEKIRLWQDSNLCLPNTNWTLLPTEISQVGSKASLEDSSFPWLKWYLSWKILLTWISHLDSIFFLQIQIIPENSFVIRNLEENRVRIFVDRQQTVTRTPHIGWQKDFFFSKWDSFTMWAWNQQPHLSDSVNGLTFGLSRCFPVWTSRRE